MFCENEDNTGNTMNIIFVRFWVSGWYFCGKEHHPLTPDIPVLNHVFMEHPEQFKKNQQSKDNI